MGTDPRHRIQSDSGLWFGITWQHQNQPASFQDAMPAGLNRLERRQHSIAFRFGSGDGICPAGFYYLSIEAVGGFRICRPRQKPVPGGGECLPPHFRHWRSNV